MIRHIVILYFDRKYDKNYLGLLEETRALVMQIPGVIKYSIFANQSKYVPSQLFEEYLVDPKYMVLTHVVE